MGRTRCIRVLVSVALVGIGLSLPIATAGSATATEYGNPTLDIGITGYGTATYGGGNNDCAAPVTTPGLTAAGQEDGATFSCPTAIIGANPGITELCTTTHPDANTQVNNCYVQLTASTPDPAGWTFDHWYGASYTMGDCGTATTCTVQVSQEVCDTSTPTWTCNRVWYSPRVVAEFLDTRTPVTQITSGPGENSVNWDDTQTASFGFSSNEDSEIGRSDCRIDGVTWSQCVSGTIFTGLSDGLHTFCVRQSDASGLVGTAVCRDWEQEANVTAGISATPDGDTADSGSPVSLTLSSNKTNHPNDGGQLSYQCWLDSEAPHACAATVSEVGLANGSHTLHAIATFAPTDGGSPMSSATATYTWTQNDVAAPVVTFGLPSAQTGTSTPGLTYSIDDPRATVTCTSDQVTVACDQHSAALPTTSGIHTLVVTATDAVGNGASYQWTWDKESAPIASIASGPADGSKVIGHAVTFGLGSAPANTTLACRVDSGNWAACSGTKSLAALTFGAHTLAVQATYHSSLGSTLAGPIVVRHWSMIPAPSCTIRLGPRLRLHHATFTLTCNRTGTMAVSAQVRVGTRTLMLAHGTVAMTAGRTRTISFAISTTTWNRMLRGHRYRANAQVYSGRTIMGRGTALVYAS